MKKVLSILFVFFACSSYSQEMMGLVNSNYAGSNGIYLNPSSIANSKIRWDINLLTFNVSFSNNYFYLPKRQAGFFSIVTGDYTFPYYPKPFGVGQRNIYAYYKDKTNKDLFTNVRIIGPSGMFRIQDHTFAIHTGARVMATASNVPYDIANFAFFTMDYAPQHNQNFKRDNYYQTAMSWAEIGFSYATMVKRSFYHRWGVGATLNILVGNSGAYINGGYTDYIAFNDSLLTVNELNGEIGLAVPVNHYTNELELDENLIKGLGFGLDLGVTYFYCKSGNKRPLKDGAYCKNFEPYTFKLAVAINDIGFVRYNSHAEKHVFSNASKQHINVQQMEWDNLAREIEEINELFFGEPDRTYAGNRFNIFLPTALTIHADYKFNGNYYLSGIVVAPVGWVNPQLKRPVTIAAIPRYETRYFEVNIPISLYNWRYPRIGLSVRIHDFTIGTDKLGGYFENQDFTGMDIYFSYKINFNGHSSRFKKIPCNIW